MESQCVSEKLCLSRMVATDLKLDAIGNDSKEARAGVGRLIRIVAESNGGPSLCEQVSRNTDYRGELNSEGLIEIVQTNKRFREEITDHSDRQKQRRFAIIGLAGGWTITLIAIAVQLFTK